VRSCARSAHKEGGFNLWRDPGKRLVKGFRQTYCRSVRQHRSRFVVNSFWRQLLTHYQAPTEALYERMGRLARISISAANFLRAQGCRGRKLLLINDLLLNDNHVASGSAYRGSNPWGAANFQAVFMRLCHNTPCRLLSPPSLVSPLRRHGNTPTL